MCIKRNKYSIVSQQKEAMITLLLNQLQDNHKSSFSFSVGYLERKAKRQFAYSQFHSVYKKKCRDCVQSGVVQLYLKGPVLQQLLLEGLTLTSNRPLRFSQL